VLLATGTALLALTVAVVLLAVGNAGVRREREKADRERAKALAARDAEKKERARVTAALAAESLALQEKEAQRLRAQANLKRAFDVLDRMYRQEVEKHAGLADRGSIDRAWTEQALAFYEAFARKNADDPEVAREAARAYHRVGDIRRYLNEQTNAAAAYRRAVELLQGLHAAAKADAELARELAMVCARMARSFRRSGEPDRGVPLMEKALALLQPLADGPEAPPDVLRELADVHNDLAVLLDESGRRTDALPHYRWALDAQADLVRRFPRPEHKREVAGSNNTLALLLTERGDRRDTAADLFRRALALLDGLPADRDDQGAVRRERARACNGLGLWHERGGDLAGAARWYRQARTLHIAVAAEFSALPEVREEQAGNAFNLALVLEKLGEGKEAGRLIREAIGLRDRLAAEYPSRSRYQHELAALHLHVRVRWMLVGAATLLSMIQQQRGEEFGVLANVRWTLSVNDELVEIDPDELMYLYERATCAHLLATMHLVKGRMERCREPLEKSVADYKALLMAVPGKRSLARELAFVDNHLAQVLLELGDHAAAARVAAELAEAMPGDWKCCQEAAWYLGGCVEVVENDATLSAAERQRLAEAYGKQSQALLAEALKRASTNDEALDTMMHTVLDRQRPSLYNPAQAVEWARQLVHQQPGVANHHYRLGATLYRFGDWRRSLAAMTRSIELRRRFTAYEGYFLAMALHQLGDRRRAAEEYLLAAQWHACYGGGDTGLERRRTEAEDLLWVTPFLAALRGERERSDFLRGFGRD
jgi:tetratricopeptide (TPR) repeat protein